MPVMEFVTRSNRDSDNEAISSERLINCYPEPVIGGQARYAIKPVLGLSEFLDSASVLGRALSVMNGVLYAVIGGNLYSISSAGVETDLGNVTDSAETSMAGNNGTMAIAAGGTYYTWDGSTLTTPTGGAFSSVGSVEFLGQYTIMTEKDGRRVQWSAVADPTSLSGTDFATTEARDDDNLRVVAVNGNLLIFKESSTETWYQVPGGSGAGAFARMAGGVMDIGLKAYNLVTKFDGGVFFVGDDSIAYITSGGSPTPVSTPPLNTAITDGSPTHCFYYEDEGHKFCVIRFSDRPAWVYDISTGIWHERAFDTNLRPWGVQDSVYAYGGWKAVGQDGVVSSFSKAWKDGDTPLSREITSRTLTMGGRRFRIPELEFSARVGRTENTYGEPQVMMAMSRDYGQTWGSERTISLGEIGDYDKRVIQRGLGQFRQATVRLRMTDPVNVAFNSAANVRLA